MIERMVGGQNANEESSRYDNDQKRWRRRFGPHLNPQAHPKENIKICLRSLRFLRCRGLHIDEVDDDGDDEDEDDDDDDDVPDGCGKYWQWDNKKSWPWSPLFRG